MTRSNAFSLVGWALMASLALCVACSGKDTASNGVGSVDLPLVSTTPDGVTYVLQNVTIEVTQSGTPVTTLTGIDEDLSEATLSAELDAGDYTASLVDGWQLTRLESDDSRTPVDSVLANDAVQDFTINDDGTTTLRYVFLTDDGSIVFGGALEIAFEVRTPNECCADGDCLCRGPAPTELTSDDGPYAADSYSLSGAGCVYYPTDAVPPFAAVAIADGFLGSGGCAGAQTGGWGPFYASHGIVTIVVETSGSDQPQARGAALLAGIAALKTENTNGSSPLNGQLAGRYGTSGFSMGGGGTTFAVNDDPTLLSSAAIMPWGADSTVLTTVPSLFICGTADTTNPCGGHAQPAYDGVPDTTPKLMVTISSSAIGQPTAGGGLSGAVGLGFQKVFLEGDERWRPLLVDPPASAVNWQTNIE